MAEELARITASAGRRYLGVGTMIGLGAMLLYVAFSSPPQQVGWLVFLVICGLGALFLGQITWRATSLQIVLTDDTLSDTSGEVLARLDDIERVDRGMFAVKPSNGFTITLRTPGKRIWRPGMWWRLGRRVAVGGVTAARHTKPLADILAIKVAQMQQQNDQ